MALDDFDLETAAPDDDGRPGLAAAPDAEGKGSSFDWSVVGGIILGFGSLAVGALLEGSSLSSYLILSAAIIVFGGTLAATLTSVGWPIFRAMPQMFMRVVQYQPLDRAEAIRTLVTFAEKARREGLLVLEDDLQNAEDEFLRKGVQLVVDGTDPELVKEILQTEVDALAEEHERNANAWTVMGGYSPTLGIIGTVMGLVFVLGNLSDPSQLGPLIAVAFVATLYGVAFANLVYLPIGMKLGACSQDEIAGRELMIEGILAIQSGDNPRIVEEKLVAFLDLASKREFLEARRQRDEFELM